MARNLAEGNQWLEDSGLENDTNIEHNFPPSPTPKNSSHKFTDLAEEDNSTRDNHPPQNHNESRKKSFMKRPSVNTAEGNAKKCKSFHPEPSTSGIHLNATTPVVQSKGSGQGIIGNGSSRCRGSKREEVTEEEDEVKGMDEVRQTILKTELQDLEIRMEMKYRTMVDNILVPWLQWKLKMSSLKQKCPQL